MKTTSEISDATFRAAKKVAGQRRTTLCALIEAGLRRVLDDGDVAKPRRSFRFQRFGRAGSTEEAAGGSWDAIRRVAYEARGE